MVFWFVCLGAFSWLAAFVAGWHKSRTSNINLVSFCDGKVLCCTALSRWNAGMKVLYVRVLTNLHVHYFLCLCICLSGWWVLAFA